MKKLLLLLALPLLFTACSSPTSDTEHGAAEELIEKIKAEQSLRRDITLELRDISESDDSAVVEVVVKNPSLQTIESMRSWIAYPTDLLEGADIEFLASATLFAPGENVFDEDKGMVQIGLSLDTDVAPEAEMIIATITFAKQADAVAALNFFDPQVGTNGHTQVLVGHKGSLRNALNLAELDPLFLQ